MLYRRNDGLEFNGQFPSQSSAEEVTKKLGDINFVSQCLPTLGKLELLSNNEFFATFKVDLNTVAGKMRLDYLSQLTVRMHFKYLEKSPNSVVLEGSGRAVGSKIDLKLRLQISEGNNESLVAWAAQAEFGKLLKLFGDKIIRDLSTSIINDLTACLSAKLSD